MTAVYNNEFEDEDSQHSAITQLDLWRKEAMAKVEKEFSIGRKRGMSEFDICIQEELRDTYGNSIEKLISNLEDELDVLMARLRSDLEIGVATKDDQDLKNTLENVIAELKSVL